MVTVCVCSTMPTKTELYKLAVKENIKGRSKMNKAQLLKALHIAPVTRMPKGYKAKTTKQMAKMLARHDKAQLLEEASHVAKVTRMPKEYKEMTIAQMKKLLAQYE